MIKVQWFCDRCGKEINLDDTYKIKAMGTGYYIPDEDSYQLDTRLQICDKCYQEIGDFWNKREAE